MSFWGYCCLAVLGVRVRFWLFRGLAACFTVICPFMPLFARFVRGFVGFLLLSIILLLSGGCRLCVCCVRRFLRFGRLFLTAFCLFNISALIDDFSVIFRHLCVFLRQFFFLLMTIFIFFLLVSVVSWRFVCLIFLR